MASIAEQIAARIATLGAAVPALTGVYRDRDDAFTREESPALLVELVDEDTQPLGGGRGPALALATERDELRVAAIVCVRGAAWQTVADDVRVALNKLVMVDAQLQALCANLRRDRCEWKARSADQPFGYAAQIYAFTTLTRAAALDVLG
jgi:hypothetical protein